MLKVEQPHFNQCEEKSFFSSGEKCSIRNYRMKRHHTEISIKMNEATGQLKVDGNFPMFWNGHNITFPYMDFHDALSYVSDKINVDLFPAYVEEFDHSATFNTNKSPKIVIQNHLDLPGHLTKPEVHGKYFVKKGIEIVKMYDAGRRLKQLYSKPIREGILSSIGIDTIDFLIRFEKKILHPGSYFKRKLTVNDILKPDFILQCNQDLMDTYDKITKAGCLQLPNKKKHLNTSTLPLIVGKELGVIFGFNFDELIMQKISSFDDSILSKEDKKARKKQIRANAKLISKRGISEYDLSEQLAESLKMASGGKP